MEDNRKLNDIIEEWLNFKKITVKESTYCRYIYIIEQYIIPNFKEITMKELEHYDFNKFIEKLLENLQPVSVKNTMTIFKSILGFAEKKYGYKFNFDFIAIPKVHREALRVLSAREKNKLCNILKPLKKEYSAKSFFLTGSSIKYIEPRNYQNTFKKCVKECKIKDFHFHHLRHSCASLLLSKGVPMKAIQEWIGHSTYSTTANFYTHLEDNYKTESANVLATFLKVS